MSNRHRKFADDGWALWIDGDDRSAIYLNEWINPKGKSYVDVCIRITGAKAVKTVNVFAPFKIKSQEITDLSHKLYDHAALRALFNTNVIVDSEKNEYTSLLHYNMKTVSLINLTREYVSTRDIAYGTVTTIDFDFIKDYITADDAYIIFRIPHKTLDEIFTANLNVGGAFEKINTLIHSPIISEKYGYSIRINEARLLPSELNEIEVLQQQRVRKALVTISIGDEYNLNDSTCYRIRRLEAELNHNYAPDDYDCSNAITYQWVQERDANMKAHYNFYFTLENNRISQTSVLIYLFIVLLCGVFGCALYDLMKFLVGLL